LKSAKKYRIKFISCYDVSKIFIKKRLKSKEFNTFCETPDNLHSIPDYNPMSNVSNLHASRDLNACTTKEKSLRHAKLAVSHSTITAKVDLFKLNIILTRMSPFTDGRAIVCAAAEVENAECVPYECGASNTIQANGALPKEIIVVERRLTAGHSKAALAGSPSKTWPAG